MVVVEVEVVVEVVVEVGVVVVVEVEVVVVVEVVVGVEVVVEVGVEVGKLNRKREPPLEDNSNPIGLLSFIAILIWAISFAIRSSRPRDKPSDEWMRMKQREFDEWLRKSVK